MLLTLTILSFPHTPLRHVASRELVLRYVTSHYVISHHVTTRQGDCDAYLLKNEMSKCYLGTHAFFREVKKCIILFLRKGVFNY